MHTLLIHPKKPLEVDHKNHEGLDNQRLNLRESTRSDNAKNRRKQRNGFWYSVHFYAQRAKWRLIVNGKYAGLFETEALAYEHLSVVPTH